ncbi:MAG: 16S rRNA (cytidine(1402)-2'-O)-methyltransferase [Anaerolineales bacterium]|nr:16S rRNA (cytidine(1402)-2'-O)-methyltransferase [Anaerolineae bacterium]PWB49464.1 MAG: 16S rRNA (cytidine(1402)-2'-O)-methyltransferase [Anaerolineales bacterium]
MSTLYLVATPIGNLEDISQRALRILAEVSLIAAEDTRHTAKLLQHYDIATRCISYHEHNKLVRLEGVLEALVQGDVALVSDAGTPALNDPGYELVRAAIQAGHMVSPIPGASAPIAALVASGLPTDAFLYLGYLPRKASERERLLKQITSLPYTLIFLEAPHRVLEALEALQAVLGDRQVAVGRELTKLHEEIFRGSLSEARQHFTERPPRGEFTLVLMGCQVNEEKWNTERLENELQKCLEAGESASKAAAGLAASSGWTRREIYRLLLKKQGKITD